MSRKIYTADLFCGAGGASTGMHLAMKELGLTSWTIAVNHWDVAISTMKHNFPGITALPAAVESVVPAEVVPGGKLDLLWASPSCTHHSRARGGKPLASQMRSQPELILTWLDQLYVRRVIVENVPEITTWGPLGSNGRPLKSRRGACFQTWIKAIEARNYEVDWRILNCADYGDATTRNRFFLQAVRKGCGKIAWPDPTHSRDGERDLFGHRPRWRGMDSCIDFSDLGQLISIRKRPLSNNTMQRIMAGIKRFYSERFIIDFWGADTPDNPRRTLSIDNPLPTCTTSNRLAIATPILMGKQSRPKYSSVRDPMMTVTTAGRAMMLTPLIMRQQFCDTPPPATRPCTTAAAGAISCITPVADSGRVIDCFFRMLKPSELAKAHSFPDWYNIQGTQSDQVRQIGNSVPVKTAKALCTEALST